MNYRQFAQTVSLIALIVSPMIVLLVIQMPLWLPPRQVALERVVHAELGTPWIDRDAASSAETAAPACKFPAPYDDLCGSIAISIGAEWRLTSPF